MMIEMPPLLGLPPPQFTPPVLMQAMDMSSSGVIHEGLYQPPTYGLVVSVPTMLDVPSLGSSSSTLERGRMLAQLAQEVFPPPSPDAVNPVGRRRREMALWARERAGRI